MKVIFGLGNPGREYKNNRHNIGYMVLDELAAREKVKLRASLRFTCAMAKFCVSGNDVLLVQPRTFMNNSGRCAAAMLKYYRIEAKDAMVVYDEADLPLGALRFREKGSAGGHRGLSSIIEAGYADINRLRLGIGKREGVELADYVLSDFSPREKTLVEEILDKAAGACIDWVNKGSSYVMSNYNTVKNAAE